jgi:hypothetical protein
MNPPYTRREFLATAATGVDLSISFANFTADFLTLAI